MKHIAETFLCKYSYAIEIYYATHFALDKLKSFNKKLWSPIPGPTQAIVDMEAK